MLVSKSSHCHKSRVWNQIRKNKTNCVKQYKIKHYTTKDLKIQINNIYFYDLTVAIIKMT